MVHLRIVGQLAIDGGDRFGERSVRHVGPPRHQHRDVCGEGFAVQPRLRDRELLHELRLDPFRVHVAPVRGDELVLAAPVQHEEAVVEMPEIAGREPLVSAFGFAEVAEHPRAADKDFAVGGDANFGVRQRASDGADAALGRRVETDDGAAFGQAIAFEHRQPERLGPAQQRGRHASAAHRDEAQRLRQRRTALGRGNQHQQQLRQQDHAVRLGAGERGEKALDVEAGRAAEPDVRHRQQLHPGAGEQRGIQAGDVFEQRRERQHAQVTRHEASHARLPQAVGDRELHAGVEANAFRLPRAAGRVSDLHGARWECGRVLDGTLRKLTVARAETGGAECAAVVRD